MILVVDIGNTDIVFGFYDQGRWMHQWRHPSAQYLLAGQMLSTQIEAYQLKPEACTQIILSSVVPGARPHLQQVLTNIFHRAPLILGPELYAEIDMDIDSRDEIGADLVANAVAGYAQFQQACIVVDFGTALSFTCISAEGKILGVSIAPGLRTAMKSLFHHTAQLPEVPLEIPQTAIGKNTAHALQSGVLLGYTGLIRELITRMKQEIGTPTKTIATGGLSSILVSAREIFDQIDPLLTLEGLRLIAQRFSSDE